MTNRRSLILALTAAALTPTVTFAAEAGDIFGGILQGIKDRKDLFVSVKSYNFARRYKSKNIFKDDSQFIER